MNNNLFFYKVIINIIYLSNCLYFSIEIYIFFLDYLEFNTLFKIYTKNQIIYLMKNI